MTRKRLIPVAIALTALVAPTAASAADRDHDKMRDSWEKHYKLNPRKNDARKDKDRDGLKNLTEFRAGTNPRKKDSDGDGRRDDHEGAGTIKSFDSATGVLVIDLFDSDQDLTGKVDSTTEIECEDEHGDATTGDTRGDGTPEDHARDGSDDSSGSGSGDDDGAREDNSGPGREGDEDRDNDGDDDVACSADFLDVGRTVKEAELNEGDDGPADVFDEIELIVR